MDVISESTGITIGLALTLLGGVAWLTKVHMDVSSLNAKVKELEDLQKEDAKVRSEMRDMLIRIEEAVKRLQEDVKKISGG